MPGPIPTELGNLVALYNHLYLHDNALTGTSYMVAGAMEIIITVCRAVLLGRIPIELGRLTKLSMNLYFSKNRLTGTPCIHQCAFERGHADEDAVVVSRSHSH